MNSDGNPVWLASEAGQHLQATLSQEKTLQALDRLLTRIDSLERSVNKMASMAEQAPGMISMVTDIVDETIESADQRGVDLESRMRHALDLAERLTAPETVAKIEGLLAMAEQLPGMLSMMTDMVDETVQQAGERGIDMEYRMGNALALAEKITEPEMVDRLDHLNTLVRQAPGLIALTVDALDEVMQNDAVARATTMVNLKTLATLGMAGEALSDSLREPPRKLGLWGMIRALGDPDVQKAAGFLINFGKNFGKQMNSHS